MQQCTVQENVLVCKHHSKDSCAEFVPSIQHWHTYYLSLCILSFLFYILDWFRDWSNYLLNFYPLYRLPEDDRVSDRNMQEVIVCKTYITSVHSVRSCIVYTVGACISVKCI